MKAPPLHRGYGHAVRHFYSQRVFDQARDVEFSPKTPLCSLAVFDLGDAYSTLSGPGPFCPSCLRVLSKTIDLPVPSANQVYWFWAGITFAGMALLALGLAIGELH